MGPKRTGVRLSVRHVGPTTVFAGSHCFYEKFTVRPRVHRRPPVRIPTNVQEKVCERTFPVRMLGVIL